MGQLKEGEGGGLERLFEGCKSGLCVCLEQWVCVCIRWNAVCGFVGVRCCVHFAVSY